MEGSCEFRAASFELVCDIESRAISLEACDRVHGENAFGRRFALSAGMESFDSAGSLRLRRFAQDDSLIFGG